jgi:hypothetical protein
MSRLSRRQLLALIGAAGATAAVGVPLLVLLVLLTMLMWTWVALSACLLDGFESPAADPPVAVSRDVSFIGPKWVVVVGVGAGPAMSSDRSAEQAVAGVALARAEVGVVAAPSDHEAPARIVRVAHCAELRDREPSSGGAAREHGSERHGFTRGSGGGGERRG